MIEVALNNPTDLDIIDYPISECMVDDSGNPKIDPATQQPRETGEVYVWSLAAKETKLFPKYVADYLKQIYGFLKVVSTPKKDVPTVEPEVEK